VVLIRADVSEERSDPIIRVTRIGVLRKTLAVVTASVVPTSPILVTLMLEGLSSSEMSFLTRAIGLTSQETPFFKVQFVLCMISWHIYGGLDVQIRVLTLS
jgi:hypothetical protein